MKKLISVVLAGAVIMGACACNKKDSPKATRDNDTTVEDAEETEADAEDVDETEGDRETDADTAAAKETVNYEDEYWFVDPTDEKEMKKLVDDLIACEPKLNDKMNDDNDMVGKRVGTTFDHMFSEYSLFSYGHDFHFEYGSEMMTDIYTGRDHVRYVSYSGYELEDEGRLDFTVKGYKEGYTHKERPAGGSVVLFVYDEDRAKACRDIWIDYVRELYKDEITEEKVWESGNVDFRYSEKVSDVVASVTSEQMKDEDHWCVSVYITFNTPDMMPAG